MNASKGGGANVSQYLNDAETVEEVNEVISKVEMTHVNLTDCYAAPEKWNFYPPYTKQEKEELIESVKEEGILDPLILWKIDRNEVREFYEPEEFKKDPKGYSFSGDEYMILSGHNRGDAALISFEKTKDEKFLTVPARVIAEGDKDNFSKRAEDIILDTNYHQRKKAAKTMQLEVIRKCKRYEEKGYRKKEMVEMAAKDLDIAQSTIYRRLNIDQMIPELKEMFFDGVLSSTSCDKLGGLRVEAQNHLLKNYKAQLLDKNINRVLKKIRFDTPVEIIDLYMQELNVGKQYVTVSIQVPADKKDEFLSMTKEWLSKNDSESQDKEEKLEHLA